MRGVDTKVLVPDLPGMVTQKRIGPFRNTGRRAWVVGGIGQSLMQVPNSSLVNVKRAVAERVLYIRQADGSYADTPKPVEGLFQERLKVFRRNLLKTSVFISPIAVEDFASLYRGRKRTSYEAAVASLRTRAVERRDAFLKSFLKFENTNTTAKPDPCWRLIQPRGARYNVSVGVYLRAIEPLIYRLIKSVFKGTTVAKGLNSQQTGDLLYRKWRSFVDPVAVGLDASRFDQHVSLLALMWEHGIYNAICKSPVLAELLSWQLQNSGAAYAVDGKVKYRVNGCRMSGDMNTSLGNCLLMCAMIYSYMSEKGMKPCAVNNGDDVVCFMERKDLPKFMDGIGQWFTEMGFTMKVEEPVYELERVEFCQAKPLWTPEGYIMCRNIVTAPAKDATSTKPLDSAPAFLRYLAAIGQCGGALSGGVPIFQEFYEMLTRNGKGATKVQEALEHGLVAGGLAIQSRGMNRTYGSIHPRSRYSFWLAFGVTPSQQLVAEEYYRNLSLKYCLPVPLMSDEVRHQFGLPQAFLL